MRWLVAVAAVMLGGCGKGEIPQYACEIVNTYPHDRSAFAEGLFFLDGFLYESTGEFGESSIRKVKLETGEVVQRRDLPAQYFGEGIVKWRDRLIMLEYQSGIGFIFDFQTFDLRDQFHYPPEGWALTTDGKRLIMDDGTARLRFWDPETLQEIGGVTVTAQGQPVKNLNELEWVKGEILANVWTTDRLARINPENGEVTGWVNCGGLLLDSDRTGGGKPPEVLNGIAYDAAGDRLFVTGKRWPKLFEVRLVKR